MGAKKCAKGESNPRHSYIFGMAKLYFTTKPLAHVVDKHRRSVLYNPIGPEVLWRGAGASHWLARIFHSFYPRGKRATEVRKGLEGRILRCREQERALLCRRAARANIVHELCSGFIVARRV